MKHNVVETIIGFIIIIIAGGFFYYAYNITNSARTTDGYILNANFENIEGLSVGSDVKLSGINIGYVETITLEKDTFFAKIYLRIKNDIEIPKDSRAMVSTSGFIGNKYIRIIPGASEVNLINGDRFLFTQSALNIEDLIAKLLYSVTSN